jgi:hypothetical protein
MTPGKVVAAASHDDLRTLETLLSEGADANEQDEQGWTPLNWAAGRGDLDAVELLLAHGADVALTGRDRRTPLMIARAASRHQVAAVLADAEKRAGIWVDPRDARPFCRAYYLRDLRRFAGWSESRINWQEPAAAGPQAGELELTDDEIVYLHQDLTVTRSMWHGESVLLDRSTPEWERFCACELEFAVPEDFG